jgi:hypothetical protein
MRRIYVSLSIGYPSAKHEDVLEVEDDATDESIDEEVRDWAHNYIEWYWRDATDED